MTQPQTPNPRQARDAWSWVMGHWSFVLILLLLTWTLRLCCLQTVPPGWRDDELINIHALSGELLAGNFPLYFTGASGHEPLYHYLLAGVHAWLGFNPLSGHVLSAVLGTLTVALTYVLARRLFGRLVAAIASLAMATSFWSLMYSRTAIRHINLLPLAFLAFYILWRLLDAQPPASREHWSFPVWPWLLLGLNIGISLYTYFAARLLPVLLILFGVYLALFHRDRFRRSWRGLLLALGIALAVALPLGIAIAQGRTEISVEGIGADARIDELAVPLRELGAGNPRPLLEGVWTTLGMFHATGDPEWLYNIPHRPVFNLLGGALLWVGVALCMARWRRPRYFFLLLWLGLGLLPAFVSVPPASLSHTILAQPVAYILPALTIIEAYCWLASRKSRSVLRPSSSVLRRPSFVLRHWSLVILTLVFLATNAYRDLRDYFFTWPVRGMVRFLYRADYRDAADYLNAHPEITDVAITSTLIGPWDRLALEVDTQPGAAAVRLFNPERALVWAEGEGPAMVLLTSSPDPDAPIDDLLRADAELQESISRHLDLYELADAPASAGAPPLGRFANGLELLEVHWVGRVAPGPGQEGALLTTWRVAAELDLPPLPIVANPPPPGVYNGPRLAAFAHVLADDGTRLAGDDGFWVDPLTLRPGDRFVQAHRFDLPSDAPPGPYSLALGLYDPLTGDRWTVVDARGGASSDRVVVPPGDSEP